MDKEKREKELQLFMIWQNGRKFEEKIINDIATKYEIIRIFEINWPEDQFARNLSRFYGKRIPKGHKKEKECGTGGFLLIVTYDHNPNYCLDDRHPVEGCNSNAVHDKYAYRKLFGGGWLVHASDNLSEMKENLLFLLGLTPEEFIKKYPLPWDGKYIILKQDMIGAKGLRNTSDLERFARKIGHTHIHAYGRNLVLATNNLTKVSRLLNLRKQFGLFKSATYTVDIAGKTRKIMIKKIA